MKNILFSFLTAVLLLISYLGCDDTLTSNALDQKIIPDSNVSFAEHIQPVFSIKCSRCHDDAQRAGDLSLISWVKVVADPGVVFPFDPENSRLVWRIDGRSSASIMPPLTSGIQLTPNQIKGIKRWIEEGAKNN